MSEGIDAFLPRRHAQLSEHYAAERERTIDSLHQRYVASGHSITRDQVEELHFSPRAIPTHSMTGIPLPVDGSGCTGCGKTRNSYSRDESCGYHGGSHEWADQVGEPENQPGDTVPYSKNADKRRGRFLREVR